MAYAQQNSRDKKNLGKKVSWYACWTEHGQKRSVKVGSKRDAEEIAYEHERNAKRSTASLTVEKL